MALEKVSEILALAGEPERVAEKLGIAQLERVRAGIDQRDFKRLLKDMERLHHFVAFEKQISDIREGRWAFNFMGKGYADKQIAKLEDKRRKLGSLIEAPRWFYKQERVRLLAAVRDYAMEVSEQGDSEWVDIDYDASYFPIVGMFESGDINRARNVMEQLEKPFAEIDPKFVLTVIEGHRTMTFDFDKSLVTYYLPPRIAEES